MGRTVRGAVAGKAKLLSGTVRISVYVVAVEHYAVMTLMKRLPKMTANCLSQ